MLYKKLNNSNLWKKIIELREMLKTQDNFKSRTCWHCKKELNIFDFLSDNLDYLTDEILKLWQNSILEFYCCDYFKKIKIEELAGNERLNRTRLCSSCRRPLTLEEFARFHNYLKINELKSYWADDSSLIFCNKLCHRRYFLRAS